jgi:hypothetical protein
VTPTSPPIKFSNYIIMQFWYPRYMSQFALDFFCGATAQIGPRTPRFWGLSLSTSPLSLSPLSITYIHTVCLPWTSDQLVAKATTYTRNSRRTSVPSEGFKPSTAVTKWIQSHALVRTTTGISPIFDNLHIISYRIQIMKFSVLFQYPLQYVSATSPIPRLTYYITRGI